MIKKKDDEFTPKHLKESTYSQVKKDLLPNNVNAEFSVIMNYIVNVKTLWNFYLKEMRGIIYAKIIKGTKLDKDFEFIFIFPKKKEDILELKYFNIHSLNSKSIFSNNYIYKAKVINIGGYENHKNAILRFNLMNNENKKINNETSNFIDIILSFHLDIKDNSTVIINELFYDINENEYKRFLEIFKLGYEKIKLFFEKIVNLYYCNETIIINVNITKVFNYIMSLKIFYNKRFKVKEIQKFRNEINIFVDIRDKQYPEYVFSTCCHISKLSDISSFVAIITLINVKFFNSKRFSLLKASIILVLKSLKKKMEKELIETSNNIDNIVK
jgi:hypothetical protein